MNTLCWSCFRKLHLKNHVSPKILYEQSNVARFHITRTPTLAEINFMENLGNKLGYKQPADWYKITRKDITDNQGAPILKKYRDSPVRLVMEVFHNHSWMPWKFDTPNQFLNKPGMEEKYLLYLGEKLGYKEKEDWYKISKKDFGEEQGGRALLQRHKHCAVQVVIDVVGPMLHYQYMPWKFSFAPRAWWHNSKNQLEYMKYLGETLGYTTMEDWYKISKQPFYDNYGGSMLQMHNGSPVSAVVNSFVNHEWQLWRFESPQSNSSSLHLVEFLDSLASKLFINKQEKGKEREKEKEMEKWYSVTAKQITEHGGAGLLQQYKTVPQLLSHAYPDHTWLPWCFKSFQGTWEDKETRREYILYLVDKVGKKNKQEWYGITTRDFREYGGRSLLSLYHSSPQAIFTSLFPEHKWELWKFNRTTFTPEILRDFLQHVEKQLNIQTIDDWLRVSYNQIQQFGPVWYIKKKGLIPSLKEAFPEKDWPSSFSSLSSLSSSPSGSTTMPQSSIQHLLKILLERNLPPGTVVEENYSFTDPSLSFSSSLSLLTADVVVPDLRLAIDYQGSQHYDSNEFFGETIIRQANDAEKRQILEQIGYTFVQVSSWWDKSFQSLASIINKQRPDIQFVNDK